MLHVHMKQNEFCNRWVKYSMYILTVSILLVRLFKCCISFQFLSLYQLLRDVLKFPTMIIDLSIFLAVSTMFLLYVFCSILLVLYKIIIYIFLMGSYFYYCEIAQFISNNASFLKVYFICHCITIPAFLV